MLADRATLRYHRHPCAGFLLLGRVSSILQGILRVSITALSHLLSIPYAGLNDGEEPIFEGVRKAVKQIGKEAATHRFTLEEKNELADIEYTYKRQGIRTSENEST